MPITILVVDDDKTVHKLISLALEAEGYELFFAKTGQEALEFVDRIVPNLILLDIVLPDLDGFEIVKTLRRNQRAYQVPITMLSGLTDLESRLKAFDAGADDYIKKPVDIKNLQARVKMQLQVSTIINTHPVAPGSQICRIAVFSLRGGLGVSTLSANLAVGLAQLWQAPTLLADLSFLNGQAALLLNTRVRATWSDIARIEPEEISLENLKGLVSPHPSGADIIAAPKHLADALLISDKHAKRIIDLAAMEYKYLVLDLPHDLSAATSAALDLADTILLMVGPDLSSVYSASNVLEIFRTLGYPEDKIQVVLNWTTGVKGLSRQNIEKALNKSIAAVIPPMPEALTTAANLGKPIVLETNKRESAVFEDLAYQWSKEENKQLIPTSPSPAWLRVMERKKLGQNASTG